MRKFTKITLLIAALLLIRMPSALYAQTYTPVYGITAGTDSIAIGVGTKVNGGYSIAIGQYSTVNGESSIAIGSTSAVGDDSNDCDSAIAIGNNTKAYGNNSVALGMNTVADEADTISVGWSADYDTDDNEYTRRIVHVSPGVNDTDAVNYSQIKLANGSYNVISDANNLSSNLSALDSAIGDMSGFGSNKYARNTSSLSENIKSLDTEVYSFEGKTISSFTSLLTTVDAYKLTDEEKARLVSSPTFENITATGDVSATNINTTGNVTVGGNLTAANVIVGGNTFIDSYGFNANNMVIRNVKAGSADSDAVNYGQVKNAFVNAAFDAENNELVLTKIDGSEKKIGISGGAGSGAISYTDDTKSKIALEGVNGTVITNVGDGEVSDNSSDAVNGKQLYNVDKKAIKANSDISLVKTDVTSISDNVNNQGEKLAKLQSDVKKNVNEITGKIDDNSDQIEKLKDVVKKNDANITKNVEAVSEEMKILKSKVLQGELDGESKESVVTGKGSIALGSDSKITGDNSISFGKGHQISGKNSGAFGDPHVITGDDSYALGNSNVITGNKSYAIGNSTKVSGENSFAIGNKSEVTGNNSFALGNNTIISHDNAIALGNGSVTSSDDSVSVGSDGNERRIQHVADAQDYHDAVNYGQFSSIVNSNYYKLNTKINKVGAGAAALASLRPMDYDPDSKWTGSIGFGNLHGEAAFAVGAFYKPNNHMLYSIGANIGGDENMVNASVNFSFGRSGKDKEVYETHKPQYIEPGDDYEFRLHEMSEKIIELTQENLESKHENAELKIRIRRLERLMLNMEKELNKGKIVD